MDTIDGLNTVYIDQIPPCGRKEKDAQVEIKA